MTDRAKNQAAASGCLGRVFTLVGLFWLGVIGVGAFQSFQENGDFAVVGGFVPALAFLFAGMVMRKRAKEAADETFVAPSTPEGTHRATTKTQPSSERGPTPSPIQPAETKVEGPNPAPKKSRTRPVPELPPLEPAPDPGQMQAVEDLDISDFEATDFDPNERLTSEEMVRRAREKFRPKKPDGY